MNAWDSCSPLVNIKQKEPQTVAKRLWLDLQSVAGMVINEVTDA
jgi:hypothetical protein